MKKLNILCVCSRGSNRSKYLAQYLRRHGYLTRYRGVEPENYPEGIKHPLDQKDVDWSDVIITVRPRLKEALKKKFKTRGKKIIQIDVTDSKKVVKKKFPEQYPNFHDMDSKTFQRKWTYARLRKSIKSYLPIK